MTDERPVVVDTDAFGLLFVHVNSVDNRVSAWRRLLVGRRVMISFQTRAELLSGAYDSGWGHRRLGELLPTLDRTPTIRADDDVIDAHAKLFAACRQTGHALQAKHHTADRWIAACAVAKDCLLLAGDAIYLDAAGVRLLT